MEAPRTVRRPRLATPAAGEDRLPDSASVTWARAHDEVWSTLVVAVVVSAIYLYTSSRDRENLDYFVRLADAFLHGRITLLEAPSWLNELIPAGPGEWYVAYPPLPAVLLVPIVALFGTDIHEQVVSSIMGGAAVGLAWLLFGAFSLSRRARITLTVAFGLGTVLWYIAEVGSVWYFAHVVAVFFMLAALNLAFRGRAPLAVGLFLGFAATSRLPVALSAPFFAALLLRLGWPPRLPPIERAVRTLAPFVVGLAIPLAAYALYNVVRWGSPFDEGYVRIPGVLDDPIYRDHGILSLWYIPRNLYAIFFRSWNFVDEPPFLQPSWWGLSIFLTTPLFLWLFRARLRDPRVAYSLVGIALVAVPIVTHGNVGITQFGYRFSLDFQPLLFVILATVFERGISRLAIAATVASVLICAYAIWAIGIGFVEF
ncbi:MAG TPA: hypothetical protein VFI28_02190 [Candidatus Limnocylindrales bacterium]|nr:hypothetical protein [Candidatus Limnocylindrales bacterium]